MHDIAKNIKQLRVQKNMTQDELAEKLFVTRQTVSNYETGKSRPDIDMLMHIAEILEVPIQDLLYEPEDLALARKAQLKRSCILGGAVAAMLLLWLPLQKLVNLATIHASSTYDQIPKFMVRFFLFPAYFLLFGLVISLLLHGAQAVKPLNQKIRRPIQIVTITLIVLYVLVTGNMVLITLPCGALFPMNGDWFFWFFNGFLLNNHQNWLFLLFGFMLGISFLPKAKNTPEP